MIEIKNRFTGEVQRTVDASTLARANLRSADLNGANLTRADLSGANLTRADLRNADLSGANLTGADLTGADLSDANLTRADLRNADLSGADLSGANLTRADLRNADLSGANLTGADLRNADLRNADLGTQWVIQGPTRSDGYQFMLTSFTGEGVRVKAGCRNFTVAQARTHWSIANYRDAKLAGETALILEYLENAAKLRGYKR